MTKRKKKKTKAEDETNPRIRLLDKVSRYAYEYAMHVFPDPPREKKPEKSKKKSGNA